MYMWRLSSQAAGSFALVRRRLTESPGILLSRELQAADYCTCVIQSRDGAGARDLCIANVYISSHPGFDGPCARPGCSAAERVAAIPKVLDCHWEDGIPRPCQERLHLVPATCPALTGQELGFPGQVSVLAIASNLTAHILVGTSRKSTKPHMLPSTRVTFSSCMRD